MSNKIKDISIKNHTYYFFDDIINIKIFDPNNIKTDEKHTKIFLFTTLYMYRSKKITQYEEINRVNPLYLIFSKVNGYLEEIDKNKYLTRVPTNESKEIIKRYEEPWSKIRDLIR